MSETNSSDSKLENSFNEQMSVALQKIRNSDNILRDSMLLDLSKQSIVDCFGFSVHWYAVMYEQWDFLMEILPQMEHSLLINRVGDDFLAFVANKGTVETFETIIPYFNPDIQEIIEEIEKKIKGLKVNNVLGRVWSFFKPAVSLLSSLLKIKLETCNRELDQLSDEKRQKLDRMRNPSFSNMLIKPPSDNEMNLYAMLNNKTDFCENADYCIENLACFSIETQKHFERVSKEDLDDLWSLRSDLSQLIVNEYSKYQILFKETLQRHQKEQQLEILEIYRNPDFLISYFDFLISYFQKNPENSK